MAKFTEVFKSDRHDWETPDSIFIPLSREFDFTLDVCANSENTKCNFYFDEAINGLDQPWIGTCWMNPPFGNKKMWVEKAYMESRKESTIVVGLIPARTNTVWWHDYCMKSEIRFIKGRPKFGEAKYGLPQPLAIVIFGKNPINKYKSFILR